MDDNRFNHPGNKYVLREVTSASCPFVALAFILELRKSRIFIVLMENVRLESVSSFLLTEKTKLGQTIHSLNPGLFLLTNDPNQWVGYLSGCLEQ